MPSRPSLPISGAISFREVAGLEPVLDAGQDAVAHELADGVPDHPFLVEEEVVDVQEARGTSGGPGQFRHQMSKGSRVDDLPDQSPLNSGSFYHPTKRFRFRRGRAGAVFAIIYL